MCDLKLQKRKFWSVFNLGDYYRLFQDFRIRKKDRTKFLQFLTDRLRQRMDEMDNKKTYQWMLTGKTSLIVPEGYKTVNFILNRF